MMTKKIIHLKQDSKGAATVEFSVLLPLLLTLSLGIYEATNYVMLNTKLNEIAGQIGIWVAASTSTATITDCFIGANLMGVDYNFSTKGGIVVNGIQHVGASEHHKLAWQVASPGASSTFSTVSGNSGLLEDPRITVPGNLIIVEVSYQYQPTFTYFLGIFPSVAILKISQTLPRNAAAFVPLPPT